MTLLSVDPSDPKRRPAALLAPEDLDAIEFNVESDGYVLLTFRAPDGYVQIRSTEHLTQSERTVVELVLRGYSNARIARARKTSVSTVANQLSMIYRKIGVKSRRELGARTSPRDTRSRSQDPIAIVESAYSFAGTEEEWLEQLAATIRANVEDDRWLVAYTYDAKQPEIARWMACCGTQEQDVVEVSSRLFASMLDYEYKSWFYAVPFVGTIRQFPAGYRKALIDERRVTQFERDLESFLREWDLADELWVNAQDPTGIGCCIGAPLRRVGLSPRDRHRWSCIAAHVATAFRIRRQFSTRSVSNGTDVSPEAIFDSNGKLAHAEQPAHGTRAQAVLRDAVRALERARGSLRRRNSEEALATWRALIAGRWSLVDHFESDGRRFIVAHRNDARVPDVRGLALRERQVLAYAALGHSNKVIAYELGLSMSTVAGHLTRARAKLQLSLGAALSPGVYANTNAPS